jgi:hypothetical protein
MKDLASVTTVVPGARLTSPQTCPPTGRHANPLPVDSMRNCGSEATYKGSTRERKFRFSNNFALTAPGGGATDRSPQPSPGLHASLQRTDSQRNCGSAGARQRSALGENGLDLTNNFALTAPGGGATGRSPQPSPGLHASPPRSPEVRAPGETYRETRNRDNDGSPVIQALDKSRKAGGE